MFEASKVLDINKMEVHTQLDSENEPMETESILHGDVNFDIRSKAEQFFLKFRCTFEKEVCSIFELFITDGIDMTELDNLSVDGSTDQRFEVSNSRQLWETG